MILGRNFHVPHETGRFRDGQAVRAQALEMELDSVTNLPSGLLNRVASRDAARQIGHVRPVVAVSFFDNDGVSHVVRSQSRALRGYRPGGETAAMKRTLHNEHLEPLIFVIRNHRVVLDADLARLYGVSTKRFNQSFKRNRTRFPGDFAFPITAAELDDLRSQFVTSRSQLSDSLGHNWSQIATSSHGGRRYLPWAFTEHGALMAANILRSERAVQMSVFLVRAFVRLREHVGANTAVLKRLAEIDRTLLRQDAALRDVYQKLLPLLQPPADPPKRRIGFHTED